MLAAWRKGRHIGRYEEEEEEDQKTPLFCHDDLFVFFLFFPRSPPLFLPRPLDF